MSVVIVAAALLLQLLFLLIYLVFKSHTLRAWAARAWAGNPSSQVGFGGGTGGLCF